MQAICELLRAGHSNDHDLVIVGAGPAGFSATLAAKSQNLRWVTIEQESLGGTVAHFPRHKLVMTQPAVLPIAGKMKFREVQKEDLINFWQDVEQKTDEIGGMKVELAALSRQMDRMDEKIDRLLEQQLQAARERAN